MNRWAAPFAALAVCGMTALSAPASDNPHVWKPEPRSVTVFKNGLGFFMREGEVQLRDGWCVSGPLPPALFGTFAIYALDEGCTVDVVGAGVGEVLEFDRPPAPSPAETRERLTPFIGLQVELRFGEAARPAAGVGKLTAVSDAHAILDTGGGSLTAIRLDELKRMQLVEEPLRVHVAGAPPNGRVRLGLAYLRKGITWVPEYSLRIVDDARAELALRATVINEAEELRNADVQLVVGVPNFVHAEFLTPLAVDQAIRAVGARLPQEFMSQQLSNAIMTRAGVAADERVEAEPAVPMGDPDAVERIVAGLPKLDAAGASDFNVYRKSGLTVRLGEKVMLTVFASGVSYTHLYRWETPSPLRHYLVLQNDGDSAWTTGPVIAVSAGRPLTEDTLHYTPAGARCELPVTTAINVVTEAVDSEVDREMKAHQPAHDYFFDLVTIEGRLRVRNFEDRPIELAIAREAPGRLVSVSDEGMIRHDAERLKLTERRSAASWTLTIDAGAERAITYRYERYVESR